MSSDHYFSPSPHSEATLRTMQMVLGGKELTLSVPSGTFSADGLDKGTRILLDSVPPPPPQGVFVDVGCGWGPIALSMAMASPEARVYAVDVNERARAATEANAASQGIGTITVCSPEDYPDKASIDLIWSNPPIRIGKNALHELLHTWLNRLSESGEAWLVVSKQLGSDSLQKWLNDGGAGAFTCDRVTTDKGYR
ncbi:MAG: class I SAM-dependent methyltransferase, partial [Pontimonas sp.]